MAVKKQMNFQSLASLQPIVDCVNEAAKVLQEQENRLGEKHPVLAGFFKASRQFAFFTLSPPLAIGAGIVSARKKKQLQQEKERLLQATIERQNAIIEALQKDLNQTKEHAEHLQELNQTLQNFRNKLQADLESEVK